MPELIENLEEQQTVCMECKNPGKLRSFILRDSRPYKVVTVMDCEICGHTETSQYDYEILDYGIKITCNFYNNELIKDDDGTYYHKSNDDLDRMVFTNNNTKITILKEDNSVLFDFTCDSANIDCIQGLLMRGEEIFAMARNDEKEELLRQIGNDLTAILNGSSFRLIIEDESGFSKICPLGKEYADIQDLPVESLNEEKIVYERVRKDGGML